MSRYVRQSPRGDRTIAERRPRHAGAIAVALAALLVGALVAVLAAGQGTASSKASGTLKLVVENNRFADARHDLAPAGDSPGDQVFNDDPVFDSKNRTRLGRTMTVTSFQEGQRALVSGALRLRDGTLTLAGVLVNGAPDIAVTGGTRAYAGAQGTYREGNKPVTPIVEDGPGRYRVTITFTP